MPRPVSQTYSVHNLEDHMLLLNDSTHNSWPQHQFSQPLNGGDDQSSDYPLPDGYQEGDGNERRICDELTIDEISPDEDDRLARKALQGTVKCNNDLLLTH